jgi:Smg protein
MFDVLVYLFENYYQVEGYPDHDTLSRKLHAAGFENEDISEALDWLNGLTRFNDDDLPRALDASASHRIYTADEIAKLSTEGRGFLVFLESARVLSPVLR